MIDKFFSIIILFITFPLLLIAIFIIICDDGLPFIFKQKRIGLNGRLFYIYKLRTMKVNSPQLASSIIDGKYYTLKSGYLFRKLSVDEVPNFINVVKGDMKIIGPRPLLFNQYNLISIRKKLGIDKIKPGITGWAQINGGDNISEKEKIELDKYYIENKSILLDITIILKTVQNFFKNK